MLNESLNQFKFDSKHFQEAFNVFLYAFNNVERPGWNTPDIWLSNCVECMLKQMLKPVKRALWLIPPSTLNINIDKITYDKVANISR